MNRILAIGAAVLALGCAGCTMEGGDSGSGHSSPSVPTTANGSAQPYGQTGPGSTTTSAPTTDTGAGPGSTGAGSPVGSAPAGTAGAGAQ